MVEWSERPHSRGLVKASVLSFIADDALSRGASIAFYVVTSIVPVLIIVISIAGAVFGAEAAQGAIAVELSNVIGTQGAELLQSTLRGASDRSAGIVASTIGVVTLLMTSSGVFSEMQAALNAIWREPPRRGIVARLSAAASSASASSSDWASCCCFRWPPAPR